MQTLSGGPSKWSDAWKVADAHHEAIKAEQERSAPKPSTPLISVEKVDDASVVTAPKCGRCGLHVNLLKCTQQGNMSILCPECGVRSTQLWRLFGAWPPQEFEDLSQEAQAEFLAHPVREHEGARGPRGRHVVQEPDKAEREWHGR